MTNESGATALRVMESDTDTIMKEPDPYQAQFERWETLVKRTEPSWVFPLRKAGLAHLAEKGFPTTQDEDWRFTNVEAITRLPFEPVLQPVRVTLAPKSLKQFSFASLDGPRLVFVDGHAAPGLSAVPNTLPKGIRIGSLSTALSEDDGLIKDHLARYATGAGNAFTALNTAFFTDGAFIHVAKGVEVAGPIHVLFISTAREAGAAVHVRNLILAEPGSRVTVLEHHVSTGSNPCWNNVVTEIVAGDNAHLEHCKFQDENAVSFHLAAVHAHLGRHSRVWSHSIVTGARLSRNTIHTTLAGEGLECVLNGLYLARGEQLADHYMVVDHAQPHCASHEYFNGILADRSRGVFHGRILVRPGAQKTDAKQTNKNLLLSDEATANTKPQLEIYADDVKCTHGATIGRMNDESIFYLRARGIPVETARRMLMHAFAGEIIDRIQCDRMREELDKIVWDRLEEHEQIAVGTEPVRSHV